MKRFVIALLISLWIPIASHSQTIYPVINDSVVLITPQQLKTTNLIFNEHKMLREKVPLLNNQIKSLEELNSSYVKQDSLRLEQINLYKNAYENSDKQYLKLQRQYKTYRTVSIVGGIALFCLGILVCR